MRAGAIEVDVVVESRPGRAVEGGATVRRTDHGTVPGVALGIRDLAPRVAAGIEARERVLGLDDDERRCIERLIERRDALRRRRGDVDEVEIDRLVVAAVGLDAEHVRPGAERDADRRGDSERIPIGRRREHDVADARAVEVEAAHGAVAAAVRVADRDVVIAGLRRGDGEVDVTPDQIERADVRATGGPRAWCSASRWSRRPRPRSAAAHRSRSRAP